MRLFHSTLRRGEVTIVQPVSPAHTALAQRLRNLRLHHWPEVNVTQSTLARALSSEGPVAAATVSSWENLTAPKLPPRVRLLAYARFFATRRSVQEQEPRLLPLEELTPEEKDAYEQLQAALIGLREATRTPSPVDEAPTRSSWRFADTGPATLVCAQLPEKEQGTFADPADPNYTELQSYADLDALVELHGHIRAENPAMNVFYKAAPNVVPDDLSGHVILLGGVVWNDITRRLSEMTSLPVRQVKDPSLESGEIFILGTGEHEVRHMPKWEQGQPRKLTEDVGLLARVPNPINSGRTLTICNGVHSRGVLGAVRSLTDARLRDANERYISTRFGGNAYFVILMRVQVIGGNAMTPDFHISGSVLYESAEER